MNDLMFSDRPESHEHRTMLVELQRKLYERNRKKIQEYEEILTPGFEAYENQYISEVDEYKEVSNFTELHQSVSKMDITVVGDFHTLRLSQKSFAKIAKRFRMKNVVLALEFFPRDAQKAIDAYVMGRANERTLLRNTQYKSRWPWDIWPHFKPIVDLARQRGWRVIGLDGPRETDSRLKDRDHAMAEVIHNAWIEAGTNSRVLALVGELHVARSHLPDAIREYGKKKGKTPRVISVFQNSDTLYWQLIGDGKELETEVVKIDKHRFCVMTAPPVVVQQSYLNWIEYHEDTLDYTNLSRHFHHLVGVISRATSLRLSKKSKEFRVYGPGDLSFVEEFQLPNGDGPRANSLIEVVSEEQSQIFLNYQILYLANLNINHVSEVASRLIHCLLLDTEDALMDTFYGRAVHEAICFFGSKIVNPKRKAHHEPYFRSLLRNIRTHLPEDMEELEIASAVLVHKSFERGKRTRAFSKIFERDPAMQHKIARALGIMLGERLYFAFSRGKIGRSSIRQIFLFPTHLPDPAAAHYFSLVRQVGREPIPRRM